MHREDEPKTPKLSRGEVESLCILNAVGSEGCAPLALAGRLGLSETVADAVARSTETLVLRGWLAEEDDRLSLTEAGRAALTTRLAELGLG